MVGKLFAYFLMPLLLLLGALAFSVIILGIGIVLVISLLWWAVDNIWVFGILALVVLYYFM